MGDQMKIDRLSIENFKGFGKFEIAPHGKSVSIYGDNEKGKTTIADAIKWLLFGKDSLNKADFDIKPLKEDGTVRTSGAHTVVEADILLSDVFTETTSLRREYYEQWTKHRGQTKKTLTGHTTDFYINGGKTKTKREYTDLVNEIAPEEIFQLVTDPRFFNEVMHWTDRRAMLLKVCGDITDEDVIASNGDLAELKDLFGALSMQKFVEKIKARLKDINAQIDIIPIRIDEAQKGIIEVSGTEASIKKSIKSTQEKLDQKRNDLDVFKAGGRLSELKKEHAVVSSEISVIESNTTRKLRKISDDALAIASNIRRSLNESKERQEKALTEFNEIKDEYLPGLEKDKAELIEEWRQLKSQSFADSTNTTCPTCGQDLPEEQVQSARDKALSDFNQSRAGSIKENERKGKKVASDIELYKTKKDELFKVIEELDQKIEGLQADYNSARDNHNAAEKALEIPAWPDEHAELCSKRDHIKDQMEGSADEIDQDKVKALESEIESLKQAISDLNESLSQVKENARIPKRIEELKQQERNLAKEYEELERQLALTEKFTRTKVDLLEDKINSRFDIARFKLYNVLVNGGLEDCCEMVVNGVPYWSLNNAMRINAGLDICNTISEFFNVTLPIIIDNAEAVTRIYETKAQTIKLYVEKGQRTLRVEIDDDI